MKVLVVLLVALFAGCTSSPDDPAGSSCQWSKGPDSLVVRGFLANRTTEVERTDVLGRQSLEHAGHPLDRIELNFGPYTTPSNQTQQQGIRIEDGVLTVRFQRVDTGERLLAYQDDRFSEARTSWVFQPGEHRDFRLTVMLAQLGETPRPAEVEAVWSFERDLDGDPSNASRATIDYDVAYWYRACF